MTLELDQVKECRARKRFASKMCRIYGTAFYLTRKEGEAGYPGHMLVYKNGDYMQATLAELTMWRIIRQEKRW